MSHTHSDFSIPLDKKITIDFALSRTRKPTSSSSAFQWPHRPRLRTHAKSGSPKSAITAPACPAFSLELKSISATGMIKMVKMQARAKETAAKLQISSDKRE